MTRQYPGYKVRDQIAPLFRHQLLQRMGVVPFLHQARFFAYADGKNLVTNAEYAPSDILPPAWDAPYPIRYANADGEYWLVRRPVFEQKPYRRFGEDTTGLFPVYNPDGTPTLHEVYCRVLPGTPADVVGLIGSFKQGKASRVSELVPTPAGYKTVGELSVGDEVLDERGEACRVLAVTPEHVDPDGTYEIEFDYGVTVVTSANHEWLTFTNRDRVKRLRAEPERREKKRRAALRSGKTKGAFRRQPKDLDVPAGTIRTTAQMLSEGLRNGVGHRQFAVPVAGAWSLPERELPIDPYVLGAWLGDGTSRAGQISGVDEGVFENVEAAGWPCHRLTSPVLRGVKGLSRALRAVGVFGNKHVPDEYLFASASQRLALLQGLMDTDGHVAMDGHCEFCNTNKKLADAVVTLASSLGIKAALAADRATLYGKDCGPKYRVRWKSTVPVFRLGRKLDRLPKQTLAKSNYWYIKDIRRIPDEPVRCIQVDSPSHLFLISERGIPTHNSLISGIYGASILCIPDCQLRIIGMEYRVARNEYEYLLDALLSERGASLFDARDKPAPPGVLAYTRMLNNPDKGQMLLELNNGAKVECRTWERSHALKGEEVDCYVWSEYYQFPGIEAMLEIRQNLAARHGRNIIATTPDRPHIEEIIDRAKSNDPMYATWKCVTDIPRRENPLAFSYDKMIEEMSSRTKEKWLIHWEGKTGEYVGSVYDYIRGQRVFTPQSHPYLWKDPMGPPTPDNLLIPGHFMRVCGFDTGTYTGAVPITVDEHGVVYFLGEFCNYRYIGGVIERIESALIPEMASRLKGFLQMLGGTWQHPADWNSQFRDEWRGYGFHFRNGERAPDLRTERMREYFQHGKAFFAPWLTVLPYEVERARFPDSPNSAGRLIRLSENDHLLDAAEHACATVKRRTADAPRGEKPYARQIDRFLAEKGQRPMTGGRFIDSLLGE